jgi:hypothetical protein
VTIDWVWIVNWIYWITHSYSVHTLQLTTVDHNTRLATAPQPVPLQPLLWHPLPTATQHTQVKVTLRQTTSRPVRLGFEPRLGLMTRR